MTIMTKQYKIILSIAAIAAAILVLLGIYRVFSPKAQEGTKAYTMIVTSEDGSRKSYQGKTDAEYLRDLMDELQATGDFAYDGYEGDYGLYITTINGVTADYDMDGAYWSIYVNGEYGMYGADTQPVAAGDRFEFAYEVYAAQ